MATSSNPQDTATEKVTEAHQAGIYEGSRRGVLCLRIGTTRRPPRGVRKNRWVRDGYFDVWLPTLAPSAKLLAHLKNHNFDDPSIRKAFLDSYERELLATAEGRQTVQFVAEVAARTPISIGCFCSDESRCHRSRLLKIIKNYAPLA